MLERSQKYDKRLARKCMAGPNALYLTEELTDSMHLEPGMLVLDLGCGRALSSVFLAREYGVRVYAVDKNEYASETCNMLRDQGLENEVFPIQADAAALPLPHGAFDALVCVNAYHNFGMEAGFFEEKLRPLLLLSAQSQGSRLLLLHADIQFIQVAGLNRRDFLLFHGVQLRQLLVEFLQKGEIIFKFHTDSAALQQQHTRRDLSGISLIGPVSYLLAQRFNFLMGGADANLPGDLPHRFLHSFFHLIQVGGKLDLIIPLLRRLDRRRAIFPGIRRNTSGGIDAGGINRSHHSKPSLS